jgi:hypothetical protein
MISVRTFSNLPSVCQLMEFLKQDFKCVKIETNLYTLFSFRNKQEPFHILLQKIKENLKIRGLLSLPGCTAMWYFLIRREDDLVRDTRIHSGPVPGPGDAQNTARLRVQVHRGGRRDGRSAYQQAGTVGARPLALGP